MRSFVAKENFAVSLRNPKIYFFLEEETATSNADEEEDTNVIDGCAL